MGRKATVDIVTPAQPADGWPTRDGVKWRKDDGDSSVLEWFYDRGCEWVKPIMDPGDFVIWDSRTVHYGRAPKGDKKRFAICKCGNLYLDAVFWLKLSRCGTDVCYKPDSFLVPDFRKMKVEALEKGWATVRTMV